MKHLSFILVCLLLAGCIGSGARHLHEKPYGHEWLGKGRDDLIITYGKPDYSTTLDSGIKLIEYTHTNLTLFPKDREETRKTSTCTTRFWLKKKRIHEVTLKGDDDYLCGSFLNTGKRSSRSDLRK